MSQICYLYRDGNCKFGSNCRFLHDGDAGRTETRGSRRKASQICYSLRDNKSCEYGDDCRYSHDLSAEEEAPAPAKAAPKEKAAPAKAAKAAPKGEKKEKAAPAKAAAKTAAPATESKTSAAAASDSKGGNERLSCFNWRDTGTCEYGDKCHYLHEGSETRGSRRREQQVCYALQNSGSCKFGDGCRFSHDLSSAAKPEPKAAAPATAASSDAAATKSPGVCYRFKRSGKCGFGDDCKFVHAAPSN